MMQNPEQVNALEDYLSSLYILSHSESTVSSYRMAIINKNKVGFRDFLHQKYNLDEIQLADKIKNGDLDTYKILKEFVIFLDKFGYKPKSIQGRMAAVKGYLRHLGVKVHSEDYKQNVRLPKTLRHREEPMTKEIILRVLRNVPPKIQTVILVLTASGMRIGELVQLKLSDIDFGTNPTTIRLRAETTKTREARETFLTSEATNSLKDYLRRYFGWKDGQENEHLKDVAIFGRTSLVKSKKRTPDTKQSSYLLMSGLLMKILSYYLDKVPGLDNKNSNGRRVIHFHAFRKFFRTTVGNVCGRDFAESLIGHHFYMDTYYNMTSEKQREMYLKAEPYLTISDATKMESSLKYLSEKYQKLEAKYNNLMMRLDEISIPTPNMSQ